MLILADRHSLRFGRWGVVAGFGMRRFTRLTNAFLKKVENHAAAIAIHFLHYNFARPHKSLTIIGADGKTMKRTPAMAAGAADHIWTAAEIVGLLARRSAATSAPASLAERWREPRPYS